MNLSRSLPLFVACMAACEHSEPFPTGPLLRLGTFDSNSTLLTFNPWDDYGASWTSDGRSITYVYSEQNTSLGTDSRCIAIVPTSGGTRTFSLCDTRSTHADSSDMFSAVTLRPDGELLFIQGTGTRKTSPAPRSMTLWLADTAAPLSARHKLADFPRVIGDSVIEFLSNAAWIDSNTFVAVGSRLTYPIDPPFSAYRDTIAVPRYLVRGVVTPSGVTLSQIPGTSLAARWSATPAGDILFVKATAPNTFTLVFEPRVMKVAAAGGTPEVLVNSPNGSGIKSISCAAGSCVLLGSLLYRLDLETGAIIPINPNNITSFGAWTDIALSPDGTTILYRAVTNVSNSICFCSRPVGNLWRAP